MRPAASPVPFIAAGVLVVLFVIVALAVRSANQSRAAASAAAVKTRAPEAAPSAPAAPIVQAPAKASAPPPARRAAPAGLATRAGGEAVPRIEPVDAGFQKGVDQRYFRAFCGSCGAPLDSRSQTCPKCGVTLRWRERIPCPFCSKNLKIELPADESKLGYCAYCGGTGKNPGYDLNVRLPFGMSRDPSGVSDKEDCPACGGSGRCRHCQGTGQALVPQHFGR